MSTVFTTPGFRHLARWLHDRGAKKLLVLAAPSRRFVAELVSELRDFSPVVFDGAKVHVPAEVVDAARRALADSGADTIVALGGGSAIGLGKALRLESNATWVAVPTTYAGSEQTTMYGITTGADKRTGKDPRVKPDLVVYDVALARELPIALTVQSLCNAIAHVVSVMSTGTEAEPGAVRDVVHAIEDLLIAPRALPARELAQRGAMACAEIMERGKAGVQHQLAHLLGGALRVDHAPLHAMLLPHFLAHLRVAAPAIVEGLERALDRRDLDAYLHDLLVRAGAPVSLAALGATREQIDAVLATRPELPAQIARDAMYGLRPPGSGGRIDLAGEPHALIVGRHPRDAKRIVLALHGRGAEAGTIARRFREICRHDPETSIVALRAEGGADRWYAVKYSAPDAGSDPEVVRAIARVETALATLTSLARPGTPIWLAGFSQGACLATEVAARTHVPLAGVLAPCGARIGRPEEWPARESPAFPVLLGAAEGDKWIERADLAATIAWFPGAIDCSGPGERHEITLRMRVAARALVLGAAPPGQTGFGNALHSEELAGAVPALQNSPRVPAHGLYAEQVNATGFTAPRADNVRSWLYRVRPSSQRRAFAPLGEASRVAAHPRLCARFEGAPTASLVGLPPMPLPAAGDARDFVDGLTTLCGAGSAQLRRGYALHVYAANRDMEHRAFYSADGDLLLLPEHGALHVMTELGALSVAPGQLALVPRGLAFSVFLPGGPARGYVAEAFGGHFRLPERGPVGANGLTDPRHFRAPTAWFEDRLDPEMRILAKLGGHLHEASQDHSPFDVAGWHGNYAPFAYDLAAFSAAGNTHRDHGDPSIFTVLTSDTIDLIVFPARVDATTNTFRPPFFHRNTISEINGILLETPHAGTPFVPGCCFITPAMTAHGISRRAVERARAGEHDAPERLGGERSMWFQLESALPPVLSPWAESVQLADWAATWGSHPAYFP